MIAGGTGLTPCYQAGVCWQKKKTKNLVALRIGAQVLSAILRDPKDTTKAGHASFQPGCGWFWPGQLVSVSQPESFGERH